MKQGDLGTDSERFILHIYTVAVNTVLQLHSLTSFYLTKFLGSLILNESALFYVIIINFVFYLQNGQDKRRPPSGFRPKSGYRGQMSRAADMAEKAGVKIDDILGQNGNAAEQFNSNNSNVIIICA